MRSLYFFAPVTALLLILLSLNGFKKKDKATIAPKSNAGFAVVELFTSEGCSSCPAADKLIAELAASKKENVYILSYHVDYWNRLGWADPFSKPEFSARQKKYASKFSSESVYTPQVVVNGSTEFVGSDKSKLNGAITNSLQNEKGSDVTMNISRNNNLVVVSYDIKEANKVLLNIALVQPEATTMVKKGENGGRTLHHVNIVRFLQTMDAKGTGNITVQIPQELINKKLDMVVFTQAKSNLKMLGADKKTISL